MNTPYPNEHACRIREPDDFDADSFRRIDREADGKPISLIIGKLKGETNTTLQAYRYLKDKWDAADAEAHCKRNDGKTFEPAKGEESGEMYMSTTEMVELHKRLREADCQALTDYKSGKAGAPTLYKPFGLLKVAEADKPMTFVASEESEDRIGDVISVAGWMLEEFVKNPTYMFCHDYSIPPIGSVPKVWIEGKQLLNTVAWDEADDFAKFIKGKFQRGMMRAESVGFRPIEFEEGEKGYHFTKQELLEISAVPIPMHPHALAKMMGNRKFTIAVPVLKAQEVPLDFTKFVIKADMSGMMDMAKTCKGHLQAGMDVLDEMMAGAGEEGEETPPEKGIDIEAALTAIKGLREL